MGLYDGLMANEPILMPNQAKPLNGDTFALNEFLKLKEKYNVKTLMELGSCVFGSTKWFSENFESVITVEINNDFRKIGLERINGNFWSELPKNIQVNNVLSLLGDSVTMLPQMLSLCDNRTIIFIDSHWQTLPLIDELKLIKNSGLLPILVVHDCFVPNQPNLGYDSYEGIDISYETMKPYLDEIYGADRYSYHYNSDAESTEVKRGIFYCYPKIDTLDRGYLFIK